MSAAPGIVERDFPLSRLTTIGTGGPARYFARPRSEEELEEVLRWSHAEGLREAVIGLGSNLLVADSGFDGLVLRLDGELAAIELAGAEIRCGGGGSLAAIVSKAARAGLSGIEGACAIPGTAGGAVRMNAGAYGWELKDSLVEAVAVSATGVRRGGPAEFALAYRSSNLRPGEVVARVVLHCEQADPAVVKATVRSMQDRRSEAQPRKARTFGSVFRNPEGERTSGMILEACGLKGLQIGGARISPKHANFIENVDGATSADVVALMAEARRRARERYGVELRHEVELVGDLAIPDER